MNKQIPKTKLVLVGGGGHCNACIDVVEADGRYEIIGILDLPERVGMVISGYSVIGTDSSYKDYITKGAHFLITAGQIFDRTLRTRIYDELNALNAPFATIISPRAHIANNVTIEHGTIVMHGAIINSNAKIGKNCIINTLSLVEHDSEICDHCHISTGAIINGSSKIGSGTFCGSGSVVIQNAEVPEESFIKAAERYKPKKPSKVAFLTTLFPIKHEYLESFMLSLSSQSRSDFDLIIVNDGFDDFDGLKRRHPHIRFIELASAPSFAANRAALLSYVIAHDYDYAIFGDVDDYFKSDRVEVVTALLDEFDIVVNDVSTFGDQGIFYENYFSNRLTDRQEIGIEHIITKNVFGFSNTAINLTKTIEMPAEITADLIAVDWYVFSCLLLQEKKAVFTNETCTYYRQHEGNCIGLGHDVDDIEILNKCLSVKKQHYSIMSQVDARYEFLYKNALRVEGKDLEEIKTNVSYPMWWEQVELEEVKNEINPKF